MQRRSFFTGALPRLLPAEHVAALTGAGVALLYVLLDGLGIPVQRTLYMLSVAAAALCSRPDRQRVAYAVRGWAWWCCSIRGRCCGRVADGG